MGLQTESARHRNIAAGAMRNVVLSYQVEKGIEWLMMGIPGSKIVSNKKVVEPESNPGLL